MSGVDTYDCPEPGCDFNVSAVGPQDPDEPDYFTEDIEQHKRGHEARPYQVGDRVRVTSDLSGRPAFTGRIYEFNDRPDLDTSIANIERDEPWDTDIDGRPVTLTVGHVNLTQDRTASKYGMDTVELLAPAPTNPPGGAVTTASPAPSGAPSLVELDRREAQRDREYAYQRVMSAALEWEYADAYPDSPAAMDATKALDTLRTAVRDYKAVIR